MAKSKKTSARSETSKGGGLSKLLGLALVAVLGGAGTGVFNVSWSDGKPQVSFDSAQLAKLGKQVQQLIVTSESKPGDSQTGPATPSGEASPFNAPSFGGSPAEQDSTDSLPPLADLAPVSHHHSGPLAPGAIPSQPMPSQPLGSETIKIASFNIQVFGTSKLNKPKAMQVLTDIVRRFDVVAIQEVRSMDDNVVPTFVNMINANDSRYDFVIGPRLGRTNSKEQYAIIFNTERIEVDRASVYTTPDPQDLLHREPMAARFRVLGVPPERAFTFTLVDIHTDPDETTSELNALADTFVGVQNNGSGEDDVILLGDLNVDEYHLGRLGQLPNIGHAITQTTTNTRRNKMYDNLVFDRLATTEYTGQFGVLDLQDNFGLSEADALQVSDHCPVWGEFSVYESGTRLPVAGRPTNPR